nr:MAG TPA: hypothetical protein [Caudoviricetes sp.]
MTTPDLTPNHPAVEALADAIYRTLSGQYGDFGTPSKGEAHAAITAALPHLTADDLRNTPAGRALMAEAWDTAVLTARELSGITRVHAFQANPYREGDA